MIQNFVNGKYFWPIVPNCSVNLTKFRKDFVEVPCIRALQNQIQVDLEVKSALIFLLL